MFNVINIIPTGIGASIGGFAGDANPVNSVLEQLCDNVITHPNAVNAASLFPATPKTLYVEGYALDEFIKRKIGLKKSYNRVGVIVDKKTEHNLTHIINAINSCIAVFGTEIAGYTITDKEIGATITKTDTGLYDGIIENPQTIFAAAERLIKEGANAIAIFAVLENPYQEAEEDYLNKGGVDPIGRIEAIISHMIVKKTGLPAAHAPIFLEDYQRTIVDPRVSAEEIGYTYIPCVIKGLQFAPQYVDINYKGCMTIDDVNALVCPYSAMNGEWLQPALASNIKIIAVKDNKTALNDTPESLGIAHKIIVAENYLEAIGILSAIKANINYKSLVRPLEAVKRI